MPGAADGVVHHQPVGERATVVRALGPDREDVGPAPHEQDLVLADMADELRAISKFGEDDALCQIGSGLPGMLLSHQLLPGVARIGLPRAKDRAGRGPARGRQGRKA